MVHLRFCFTILMLCLLTVSGGAFAADLTIRVEKDKNIGHISSSLTTDVVVLNLVTPDKRRLPLFSKLSPGKTVQVPLRFTMPEKIDYAVCQIADPPKGYQKEHGNYYHLSVDIL